MIALIKLHFNYLFSWKIIEISVVIFIICILGFSFFSKYYLEYDTLMFYQNVYNEEYTSEAISFIKLVVLLYSIFIVINGFIINKYEVFLLIRRNRDGVIISKIFVILMGMSLFIVFLFVFYIIVGLFLTPYFKFSISDFDLLCDLILFGIVYTLLNILMVTVVKNMYSLLIVFLLYFISNISLDYLILKSDVSFLAKIINFIAVDVGYFKNIGFDLYYSKTYVLALCLVLSQLIFLLFRKNDIVN